MSAYVERRVESTVNFPRRNNLQVLRLVFATQVVLAHCMEHLPGVEIEWLQYFPGVPGFFFVSGFLIYSSYLNSPGLPYFWNRCLRLFPGLVLVTIGSMGVAVIAKGWEHLAAHPVDYALWFTAQTTIGQAYNPAIFRDVGVGVLNGSLWTITTEMLFYLGVPLLVRAERLVAHLTWLLIACSFAIYAVGPLWWTESLYRDKTLFDVLALTPVVWGWMFGVGILAAKHYDVIVGFRAYLLAAALSTPLMMTGADGILVGASGNRLGLLYYLAYASAIFYLAFCVPPFVIRPDLSYGAYVWHMPLVNLVLVLALPSPQIMAVLLTFAFAAVSWFLVERPALRLKRRPLMAIEWPVQATS